VGWPARVKRSARRGTLSRFALWAAVCALLLRAAVPIIAAGAAQLRGVPMAEICTVYGVAMPLASPAIHAGHGPALDDDSGPPAQGSEAAAAHSADHCALTALAALSVPGAEAPVLTAEQGVTARLPRERGAEYLDRCAIWVSRLQHGPPLPASA